MAAIGLAAAGAALNATFAVFIVFSMFLEFYSAWQYRVTLFAVKHLTEFEDVPGVWVTVSLREFERTLCGTSENTEINGICASAANLEAAGVMYLVMGLSVCAMAGLCALNFLCLALQKGAWALKLELFHYITPAAYMLAGVTYLWVSSPNGFNREVYKETQGEIGIFVLFMAALLGIVILFYYMFLKLAGVIKELNGHLLGQEGDFRSELLVRTSEVNRPSQTFGELQGKLNERESDLDVAGRAVQISQQTIMGLSENKEELNNFLRTREKRVDELRGERDALRDSLQNMKGMYEKTALLQRETEAKYLLLKESRPIEVLSDAQNLTIENRDLLEKLANMNNSIETYRGEVRELVVKNQDLESKSDEIAIKMKVLNESRDGYRRKFYEDEEQLKQSQHLLPENQRLTHMLNSMESANDQLQKSVEEQSSLANEHGDLKRQVLSLTGEKLRLAKDLESRTKEIQLLKSAEDQGNYFLKYKKLEEDFIDYSNEKGRLATSLHYEIDQLRNTLSLQADAHQKDLYEALGLKDKYFDELQYFKNKAETSETSLEALRTLESQLQELSSNELNDFLARENGALKTQLSQAGALLEKLLKEKDLIRKDLLSKSTALSELSTEYHQLLRQLPETQRSQQLKELRSSRTDENLSGSTHIHQQIIIESLADINYKDNLILDSIASTPQQVPMPHRSLWQLLDQLMCERHELARSGKTLVPMNKFLIDSLRHEESPAQLKSFIQSLEELYNANHLFGVFFCRVFGLFHSRPLPTHLSSFLTSLYALFTAALPAESPDQGGTLSIVQVMELIMKVCRNHRAAGERVISGLPKDSENLLEMTLIKVCGTMGSMGKTAQDIFEVLDLNSGGSIDYPEFVDGIRLSLNIWVRQEEAENLCAFLDSEAVGSISRENWLQRISFQEYVQKAHGAEGRVSRAEVLTVFVEEFESEMTYQYSVLRQMVRDRTINRAAFKELVLRLDSSLKDTTINEFFEEGRRIESEGANYITPETFAIVVLRNKVGGYGVGLFHSEFLNSFN